MAEIKSTMDIIMEKTKGLTMTEEEKTEYRQQELTGKVRGLIQKFLEGGFKLEKFKVEVAALSAKQENAVNRLIIEESILHIQLGVNNEPIFQVLKETVGVEEGPIREMERAFIDRVVGEQVDRQKSLREKLEKRGVSGSSVIPNLKADPDWKIYLSDENETFKAKILSSLNSD
jgi:hypothetical protein